MISRQKTLIGSIRVLLSTICIAGVVLLTLWWIRSFGWNDNIIGPQTGTFRPQIGSSDGWMTIRYRNVHLSPAQFPKWTRQSTSDEQMEAIYVQMEQSVKNQPGATFSRPTPTFKFGWQEAGVFRTPYWLPVVTLICVAIALGWRQDWRFSLMTLLMWCSVSAVALGVAVQFFRI